LIWFELIWSGPRLIAALGLWWREAYSGSASWSDVPRLLLGIVLDACRVNSRHDETFAFFSSWAFQWIPLLTRHKEMNRSKTWVLKRCFEWPSILVRLLSVTERGGVKAPFRVAQAEGSVAFFFFFGIFYKNFWLEILSSPVSKRHICMHICSRVSSRV
jgi:hypothetical protein